MVPTRPALKKSKLRYWVTGVLIAVGILAIAASLLIPTFEPAARRWLISSLEKRYQSDVEIQAFHAGLFPAPHATVEGLKLRFHKRTDVPPLAEIGKVTVEAGFLGILERPVHIRKVTFEGLVVAIPRRNRDELHEKPLKNPKANFVLQEVVADGTMLRIIPAQPDKSPLLFEIRHLTLHSAAVDRPMTFVATLTNPKPPGSIQSTGTFGPWNAQDPGSSPVEGKYTFRDAQLSVFNGISGVLSSDGRYKGQLNHIDCDGTADVPDFAVSVGGHPVDLKTSFHATVDGTNGDTKLDSVKASFLHSSVTARGVVDNLPGKKGKQVSLDVVVDNGRVEDFIRLVVKGDKPAVVGSASFHTSFELPPGPEKVLDKLSLKGAFRIAGAHFTDPGVQEKMDGLSHRAQGRPNEEPGDLVATKFAGNMRLDDGTVTFSHLTFALPGAQIDLSGTYQLTSQAINFQGTATTQAKISEMTTGVKSFLLRAVDPLFRKKGAGAVIPIRITGTRSDPKFGLQLPFGKQK